MIVSLSLLFTLNIVVPIAQYSLPNRLNLINKPDTATLAWELNYTDIMDDLSFTNATDTNIPCPIPEYDGRVDIINVTLLNATVPLNYTILMYVNLSIPPTGDFNVFARLYYEYSDLGWTEGFVHVEALPTGSGFAYSAYHYNGTTQETVTGGAGYLSADGLYFNWTFPKQWIQERDGDGFLITNFRMTAECKVHKTTPERFIFDNIGNAQFSYLFPPSSGGGENGGGNTGGDPNPDPDGDDTPPSDFPWIWVGSAIVAAVIGISIAVIIIKRKNR